MLASEDFTRLTDPFRRELLAHCYRMLGSVHDAEDLVQETFLRAWRSHADFDGSRATLRTWLYRIATNCCLTALEKAGRRPLPSGLGAPDNDPEAAFDRGSSRHDVPWLQPVPDALLGNTSWGAMGDPAAIVTGRASVRLAFIAALQYLPPRQRAVLILRDVLDWRAAETAALLGTTTTAVNSALQRARTQLRRAAPDADDLAELDDTGQRELLARYITAFENADVKALGEILRKDAELEMPPFPVWYSGRDDITRFLATTVMTYRGKHRLVPVLANGQPAAASYRRGDDGNYRGHGVHVLTLAAGPAAHPELRIVRMTAFLDPALMPTFGLPPVLDGEAPAESPAGATAAADDRNRGSFGTLLARGITPGPPGKDPRSLSRTSRGSSLIRQRPPARPMPAPAPAPAHPGRHRPGAPTAWPAPPRAHRPGPARCAAGSAPW
jgi:RNA polymerase sigma-70 factor (ECF subfamily)